MKTLIVPLSKSNWPEGRVGPKDMQDGYKVQIAGARQLNVRPEVFGDEILLIGGLAPYESNKTELHYMAEAINDAGADPKRVRKITEGGLDTYSQILIAFELAKKEEAMIIFISTFLHFLRVVWIAWRENKEYGIKIQHKIVFGIPRPAEIFSDIALMCIYPIIDLLGKEKEFHALVLKRRLKGKL